MNETKNKPKIMLPEQLLGKKVPKYSYHYGTCDNCHRKFIPVLHFGYNTQPKKDYRICIDCMRETGIFSTNDINKLREYFIKMVGKINFILKDNTELAQLINSELAEYFRMIESY
jgi:phage anti-repressor protein